jgi:hypothetical protein
MLTVFLKKLKFYLGRNKWRGADTKYLPKKVLNGQLRKRHPDERHALTQEGRGLGSGLRLDTEKKYSVFFH